MLWELEDQIVRLINQSWTATIASCFFPPNRWPVYILVDAGWTQTLGLHHCLRIVPDYCPMIIFDQILKTLSCFDIFTIKTCSKCRYSTSFTTSSSFKVLLPWEEFKVWEVLAVSDLARQCPVVLATPLGLGARVRVRFFSASDVLSKLISWKHADCTSLSDCLQW